MEDKKDRQAQCFSRQKEEAAVRKWEEEGQTVSNAGASRDKINTPTPSHTHAISSPCHFVSLMESLKDRRSLNFTRLCVSSWLQLARGQRHAVTPAGAPVAVTEQLGGRSDLDSAKHFVIVKTGSNQGIGILFGDKILL